MAQQVGNCSMTEKGKQSIKYQVHQLYKNSGMDCIGKSKHNAKKEQLSKLEKLIELEQLPKDAINSHNIHKDIGIYSIRTRNEYQRVWQQVFTYAVENYQIKEIKELKSQHINSYLMAHQENEKKTIRNLIVAIQKLETALTKTNTDRQYNFQATLQKHVELSKDKEFNYVDRSYADVKALIKGIDNDKYKLVAKLQNATGARVSEVAHINKNQLDGRKLTYASKGGKKMEKMLPVALANKLQSYIDKSKKGMFAIDQNLYRTALKASAEKTGQEYTGSHGIRWTYAKRFYNDKVNKLFQKAYVKALCEKIGKAVEYVREHILQMTHPKLTPLKENQLNKILVQVSEALGHNRPDITKHYQGWGAYC